MTQQVINRIDDMQTVYVSGFYSDGTDSEPQAFERYKCKIGVYPVDSTEDEEESDSQIFYYFESLEEVKNGGSDFVVTAFSVDDQVVHLTEDEIAAQTAH